MENNTNEQNLQIELPEEVANGIYSNLAVITHSPSEFVCDFIQMMPNVPKAMVRSRVIMTPENAKRLMHALAENVRKFEESFGTITDRNDIPPISFGNPTTEA